MIDESKLIFIVSQPRSGSTLLQAVLSNNDKVATSSEHWMLLKFLPLLNSEKVHSVYDYSLTESAFDDFLNKYKLTDVHSFHIKNMMLHYYREICTDDDQFVIDKTPRYYECFDDIYKLFPNAKYVILIRNPIDVFRSIIDTWDNNSFNKLSQYHSRDFLNAPFLINDIIHKYKSKPNVIVEKYEDFVSNPEKETKILCDFLGFNYDSAMLNYKTNLKYQGKYGDPTGVGSNDKIIEGKDILSSKTYIENKALFEGYANYLGERFFSEYGNYSPKVPLKKTIVFSAFRFYERNRKNIFGLSVFKIFTHSIKLLFLKIFFGKR